MPLLIDNFSTVSDKLFVEIVRLESTEPLGDEETVDCGSGDTVLSLEEPNLNLFMNFNILVIGLQKKKWWFLKPLVP